MKYIISILAFFISVALSGLLGYELIKPFVWIFLIWAAYCLSLAVLFKARWFRIFSINAGLVLLLLALGEFLLGVKMSLALRGQEGSVSEGAAAAVDLTAYFDPECSYRKDYYENVIQPVLGYRVKPGIIAHSKKNLSDGSTLYDVFYTIGDNGLRKTPEFLGSEKESGSLMFFGGSFMFGEGLDDKQTIPSQVGRILAGENKSFQVLNFGLHGYGTHQMLSILQSDFADKDLRHTPANAIYLYIADHVARTAGATTWDFSGPRYRLSSAGELQRAGNFYNGNPFNFLYWSDSESARFLEKAKRYLLVKSNIYNAIKSVISEDSKKLFCAVLLASRDTVEKKYPGCRFDIILWDSEPEIIDFLKKNNFNWHTREQVIPDFKENRPKYVFPADSHPTALADKIIAEYIVKNILEPKDRAGGAAPATGEGR